MIEHWHVSVAPIGETIHVVCGKRLMYSPSESEYVETPNWWERLCGITHQMKVDNARQRVQVICDRKNAEDTRGKELAGLYR